MVNNGPPVGKPLYEGHRAIWMQEYDVKAQKLVGPRAVIVNGGVDLSSRSGSGASHLQGKGRTI
jgi:alpha-N-arabinofuranosidase